MQLLNGHLRISFGNGWCRSGREAYAGGAHDASARECRCSFVRHNRRSSGTTDNVWPRRLFEVIGQLALGKPMSPQAFVRKEMINIFHDEV
jgi:hypothetical protein